MVWLHLFALDYSPSMESYELGASLAGPSVDELAGWCSLWADILQVRMTLHAREHLVDEPANLFARRSRHPGDASQLPFTLLGAARVAPAR